MMTSTTRRGVSDVSELLPRLASRSPKPTTPVWEQGVTAPLYLPVLASPHVREGRGWRALRHNGRGRRVGVVFFAFLNSLPRETQSVEYTPAYCRYLRPARMASP